MGGWEGVHYSHSIAWCRRCASQGGQGPLASTRRPRTMPRTRMQGNTPGARRVTTAAARHALHRVGMLAYICSNSSDNVRKPAREKFVLVLTRTFQICVSQLLTDTITNPPLLNTAIALSTGSGVLAAILFVCQKAKKKLPTRFEFEGATGRNRPLPGAACYSNVLSLTLTSAVAASCGSAKSPSHLA